MPAVPDFCAQGCKSYFDGCNTCTCGEEGKPAACTKKICLFGILNKMGAPKCLDKPEMPAWVPPKDCACVATERNDGQKWPAKCATSAGGNTHVCYVKRTHEMPCAAAKLSGKSTNPYVMCQESKPEEVSPPEVLPPVKEEDFCAKGCKSYFDGCNTCRCGEEGKPAACTKKICVFGILNKMGPAKCLDDEKPKEPETCEACVAADRAWQVGKCNKTKECLVMDVGCATTEAHCKEDGKPEKPAVPDFCAKGCKSYFDGCNTCTCGEEGKPVACTKKICLFGILNKMG